MPPASSLTAGRDCTSGAMLAHRRWQRNGRECMMHGKKDHDPGARMIPGSHDPGARMIPGRLLCSVSHLVA
jgi:hypothetical protein